MSKQEGLSATVVWVALMALTIISFLAFETAAGKIATTIAILIGVVKAKAIFMYFMETKGSNNRYRWALELWALATVVTILVGYWSTVVI